MQIRKFADLKKWVNNNRTKTALYSLLLGDNIFNDGNLSKIPHEIFKYIVDKQELESQDKQKIDKLIENLNIDNKTDNSKTFAQISTILQKYTYYTTAICNFINNLEKKNIGILAHYITYLFFDGHMSKNKQNELLYTKITTHCGVNINDLQNVVRGQKASWTRDAF